MGDFIRTASGLANINRAISSQSRQAGTNIGEFMLPAMKTLRITMFLLAKAGEAVTGFFAGLPDIVKRFGGSLILLIGVITPTVIVLRSLVWLIPILVGWMVKATVATIAWAKAAGLLGGVMTFATSSVRAFLLTLGIAGIALVVVGVLADGLFKVFSGGKDVLEALEKEFGDIKKQLDDIAKAASGVNGQFRILGSLAKAGFMAKLAVQTAAAPVGPSGPRIRPGSIDAAAFRPIFQASEGATATALRPTLPAAGVAPTSPLDKSGGTLKDIHQTLQGIRRDNRTMKGLS